MMKTDKSARITITNLRVLLHMWIWN